MGQKKQLPDLLKDMPEMVFPGSIEFEGRGKHEWFGMTLRDYFAGQWLAGFAANHAGQMQYSELLGPDEALRAVASVAYDHADAMIAAREAR